MKLFEALKPKTVYEALVRVYRNYVNWEFYKKTMDDLLKNGSLKQNGMRLDKRHRAYYVLNLEPETLMMGQEVLDLEKSRVYESLIKKKKLLEDAFLGELIEAKTERIKNEDYYAYLIQIKYRAMSSISDIIHVVLWSTAFSFVSYYAFKLALNYEAIFTWINSLVTTK